jgi:DNA polymerase type B, organellar and viral
MYNAMKYGYKFKILSGYLFDKAYIFKDYISDLYEIKKSHTKDHPMYLISKLLQVSLYGKFGQDYAFYNTVIINDDEIYEYNENYSIKDTLQLDSNKTLISYLDTNKLNNIDLALKYEFNISIPIASAITAYARMANLKMELTKLGYIIFNTDTDSLFVNKPLPNNLVGKELGQLKLENIFKEIVFLAPKVYAGIYEINNIIHELIKVKGFKFNKPVLSLENKIELDNKDNKLSYLSMKNLLTKNSSLNLMHKLIETLKR